MDPSGQLLTSLVLLLVLAKLFEFPFRKAYLSPIPAHIFAGIILGPYVLSIVYPSRDLNAIAYLGLLLLMFYTGLTTDFRELKRYGRIIIVMGGMGVLVTFSLIYLVMLGFGFSMLASLFIAAALSNTATETIAAMVARKGDVRTKSLLIGASFVDDVVAVYVIGLISGLTFEHGSYYDLLYTGVKTALFLLAVFIASELLVRKYSVIYKSMSTDYFWFASISILLALILSVLARFTGLSELIGSYLAGIIISRGREFHDPFLRTRIALSEFISDFAVVLDVLFIPLFFTLIGVFYKPGAVSLPLYITVLAMAITGKFLGTAPIAYLGTRDKKTSIAVGLAMSGRGSLETALLKIGIDTGIINDVLFNTALTVSLTTTILAPILYELATRKIS